VYYWTDRIVDCLFQCTVELLQRRDILCMKERKRLSFGCECRIWMRLWLGVKTRTSLWRMRRERHYGAWEADVIVALSVLLDVSTAFEHVSRSRSAPRITAVGRPIKDSGLSTIKSFWPSSSIRSASEDQNLLSFLKNPWSFQVFFNLSQDFHCAYDIQNESCPFFFQHRCWLVYNSTSLHHIFLSIYE